MSEVILNQEKVNLDSIQEINTNLIEKYVSSKETDNTSKNYKSDLKAFSLFVNKNLLDVEVEDVTDYLKYVKAKTSISTRDRHFSSIKNFYEYYIYKNKYKERNPTGLTKRIGGYSEESKVEPLTDEQAKSLIDLIKKKIKLSNTEFQRNLHIRNLALIHLLLNTGMRIEECLSLGFETFQIDNKIITLFAEDVKGKKDRTIDLSKCTRTINYVKDYLNIRENLIKDKNSKDNKYIFLSNSGKKLTTKIANNILKMYDKELKLDLHCHRLRHTYITNVYNECKDIVLTKEIIVQQSVGTTMRYIKNKSKITSVKLPTSKF